tara:strand:+ start:654 stop:1049 length:396 start_codon:yes stop_codon:yes gene_type:complete
MNYLSHYTEQATTDALNSNGAFFAFSEIQFYEAMTTGVKYTAMGNGLHCPTENCMRLDRALDNAVTQGIAADIAENGIEAIINRELGNHEAQITGDIGDTVGALHGYGISAEQVQAQYGAFFQDCIDNDYF